MCEAQQYMKDDDNSNHLLYKTTAKHLVNVVYPPQPLENIFIVGDLNTTVSVDLIIDSHPLPYFSDISWNIVKDDGQVQVNDFFIFYYSTFFVYYRCIVI